MGHYEGGCLCGVCRYLIIGSKPQALYLCHCSRCRRETGTNYGATVFFSNAELIWEKGADNITIFKLEHTRKQRAFCKTCGSPLPRKEESGIALPAGSLDDQTSLEPTAHIFYASRSAWEDHVTGLPCFNEFPN